MFALMDERIRALVSEGLSARQIAAALGVHRATVERHLARLGLDTPRMARRKAFAAARAAGADTVEAPCPHHGVATFVVTAEGVYRCGRCRSASVSAQRRRRKLQLVAEAGGRCRLCGYDRCAAALEFHHLDPSEKRFGLGGGQTRSIAEMRREAAKCVLLCSNCHAEVEAGLIELCLN